MALLKIIVGKGCAGNTLAQTRCREQNKLVKSSKIQEVKQEQMHPLDTKIHLTKNPDQNLSQQSLPSSN